MHAVGYVRCSTDKQENSTDAQEKRIRAQATIKDLELSEVVVDSDEFSGNLNRPGVIRILDMVKAREIDAVIITKLDRLTRSTRDAIDLIELFGRKGVQLISISESLDTESPMGRFFVRMIASIAELEREMIGARTKEGMRNLKEQGFCVGEAPYGFTRPPRSELERMGRVHIPLVPNAVEQEIVEKIMELRGGGMKFARIADELNAAGYRTRAGGKFSMQSVHRIGKGALAAQEVAA